MINDVVMRRVLWVAAIFNLGAAAMFAFPSLPPGQLIGLPMSVPGIYRALLAFLVAMFGVVYAWLAMQPIIDRPLVAFSAFGKTGVFIIVLIFWLAGNAPGMGVLTGGGDLFFAAVFFAWLRKR
jgi:hypothetical protein